MFKNIVKFFNYMLCKNSILTKVCLKSKNVSFPLHFPTLAGSNADKNFRNVK